MAVKMKFAYRPNAIEAAHGRGPYYLLSVTDSLEHKPGTFFTHDQLKDLWLDGAHRITIVAEETY